MNKFCFGAIYNRRLWEKKLGVSALISTGLARIGMLGYTGESWLPSLPGTYPTLPSLVDRSGDPGTNCNISIVETLDVDNNVMNKLNTGRFLITPVGFRSRSLKSNLSIRRLQKEKVFT